MEEEQAKADQDVEKGKQQKGKGKVHLGGVRGKRMETAIIILPAHHRHKR